MSGSPTNRNRWMLPAPKPALTVVADFLSRGDVWARVGLCALATSILFVVCFGWAPAFPYRLREAPLRNIHARTTFEFADQKATEEAKNQARAKTLAIYEHDRLPLEELRQALVNDVFAVIGKNSFDEVDPEIWKNFLPDPEQPAETPVPAKETFEKFREALLPDEKLERLQAAVEKSFIEIDKIGLLEKLEHDLGEGSMQEIEVYQKGNLDDRRRVVVSDVRIAEAKIELLESLKKEIQNESELIKEPQLVAERIYDWLRPQLPSTLTWDQPNTKREKTAAAAAVQMKKKRYMPGDALENLNYVGDSDNVIAAGVPLDITDIGLLAAEHEAYVKNMSLPENLIRSVLFFGLFAAVFSLTCSYMYYRDRNLLNDLRHFVAIIGMMVLAFVGAWLLASNSEWRSEVIPLMLFAMIVAISYHIELSIFLSALVAIAFTVAHGFGMAELVVLTSATSTSALLCRTIRSRTKLVYIGLAAAAVVFPTVIGVKYLLGQPIGTALWIDAVWYAGAAGFAGLLMTALLPFLEHWLGIQTDISLLELSDANHPLLKELVQRAPGTYNHSINVASLSEAAAESIGANGLLCRVGAYFHDVGKLRKPEYFIENQGGGENKHDDLMPNMSTLVIIAHVKDGVEIGRTHRLPARIIDLIEQHHGTTVVEYFYKRATRQSELNEDEQPVDEANFRYPGPKPQTPEAAVMMVADAVESASRALREPTPARIKSLVKEIAKRKLDDGQFDQCSITIQQLSTIQESLIKSLNAMYHARVQYPDQQTA